MSRSILNEGPEVNVYLNRDPIEATLPVQAIQPTVTDPVTISLKGLSGFTGQAGKVIKVNSGETALEYADDEDTTQWVFSSGLLYPNLTTTDVAIGGTTNADNRKFKVHGDAEITTQLYLTGSSSTIELNNNSSSGLYFNNNTGQGFKLFADNGFSGSPHLNNITSSGWLFKISSSGTQKHRFLNGITEIYSDGASTDTTKHYFVKASDTNIGNYIQNDFTNNTFQLRTFTSTTDEYFLQYDTANSVFTIPDKLVLSATTNQLSDGTNNYILPSSSGTLALTTDPADVTTVSNFGTASSSDVNVGYAGGNSLSIGLNLYGDEFKLYNTGNVNVATFTPVSNSCNLTLNGGVISSANWQGTAIPYNYGGTGLTSLTPNKILQVNGTANGFNQVDLPTAYWTESGGVLSPATSTNAIRSQASLAFRVGSATSYTALDYNTSSNLFSLYNTASATNFIEYNGSFNVITNKASTIFENQIQVNSIKGENSTTNTIKDDGARGWEFVAVDATKAIAIESGSYYPYLGVDSANSKPFLININNISGNAYEINDTNNTLAGLRHEFYGDVVFNSTIRAEGGSLPIRIGSTGDYTALEYEEANDIFYLYNSTSTKYFMEYQAVPQTTLFRANNFTISSGTANNDCVLLIEADTDNNDENANPEIRLRADGGVTGANMKLDDNDFLIETIYSGQDIVINPVSGANCEINASLTKCSSDFECASSRFRVDYGGSSYTNIYNPTGTNAASNPNGSHIYYHDNGTALGFGVPNTSSASSNGNNFTFVSGGSTRCRMNGSTNPSIQFYQTNGSTVYGNIGRSGTFPANFGQWSSVNVPISGQTAMYFGGFGTNDAEGCWFAQNGNTTGFSNPGDDRTLWWYDEDDTGTTNWYISTGGIIVSSSDVRLKTNIETYRNSSFEKYKQIRTVTYNKRIPESINPERLKKQSCIEKYNELHFGVIAQELYELYPELEDTKDRDKWIYRRDNWDTLYEEEHNKWLEEKEQYECCDQKDCEEVCEYKQPEPQKEFNEEEPMRKVEYQRLSLLTIGVVQDLIKENESLKQELASIKDILARNNIS
jgi:hypothetical protein